MLLGRVLIPLCAQGRAINKRLTRKYDLWRTGVTTDSFTPKGAVIMVATVLLYAIVQVLPPFLFNFSQRMTFLHDVTCLDQPPR